MYGIICTIRCVHFLFIMICVIRSNTFNVFSKSVTAIFFLYNFIKCYCIMLNIIKYYFSGRSKASLETQCCVISNEISDHQAVVVNINLTMPRSKTKFITIYSNSAESKINFKNDISSKGIYDKLDKNLHADPNINYNILEKEIINSMETHMQKKTVKFNRRKHKRDPWITFGILRSVNKKNQLYRTLKQTKMNLEIYETRKQRFNQF